MCRLALFNRKGLEYIEGKSGLTEFFNHLEDSFGGHGNGCLIIYNNNKTKLIKGVKLDNQTITDTINNEINKINYVMYHTRLASKGTITDTNCHPFKFQNDYLMMNGTEYSINPFVVKNETDTETILKLTKKQKLLLFDVVKNFNSVFIGRQNNKLFVTKGKGDLHILKFYNALIFASEFPEEYYTNNQVYEAPKSWLEGEKINVKKLKVAESPKTFRYNYTTIYNSRWDYADRFKVSQLTEKK